MGYVKAVTSQENGVLVARRGGWLQGLPAMSADALRVLEPDDRTRKRAQYEGFTFDVTDDGEVVVTNESHADGSDHTYTVHVESGVPTDCTCPAFKYDEGPCKHQTAVAINDAVLKAVQARQNPRQGCWCADKELACFDHFEVTANEE